MTQHESACNLASLYEGRNLNEADTRHKIIDVVLHDVLSWPRNQVACESYINPGYSDYLLRKPSGDPLLFIEAKKEGIYFKLPYAFSRDVLARHISVSALLTTTEIKDAMQQVFTYCISEGCEYAAITNGHEWIFFKVFERGRSWKSMKAFVVSGLHYFCDKYVDAVNIFGYTALTDHASLSNLLSVHSSPQRDIYYAKDRISAYNEEVNANRFAPRLRPLVERYFGVIRDNDIDFMNQCYVSVREYDRTYKGVYSLIRDSLSPYFKKRAVKDFDDDEHGGLFGKKLARNLQRDRKNELIVLFGGKGAGKSTFLRKLLYHKPPSYLAKHSKISIVDLLNVPEDEGLIRRDIWEQIIAQLDQESILKGDRGQLLYLFDDKYDLAKKQVLYGLDVNSEAYNVRLNELVSRWLEDREYCAEKLSTYWRRRHKGVIVVIDNSDQFSTECQDFCFSAAREVSARLGCLVIISMREERYYSSKIHGILDAFSFSGFHISSPFPELVFQRRIDYVLDILKKKETYEPLLGDVSPAQISEFRRFFKIFSNAFRDASSPLNKFLAACAHGNIRLALDLFKGFMLSGYTNVDEMTSRPNWTISVHQVVKPVMVPDRFFYDEKKSAIPNLFQVRSKRNGSHFTAIRLLRMLIEGEDPSNPPYVSVVQLRDYFSDTFNMAEDFERNLDVLLRYGFVEANNRLDAYSQSVDNVKITNYGLYVLDELAFFFAYLDLVCIDCGVFEENMAHYFVIAANDDYKLFRRFQKLERVQQRLDKTEEFLKYLIREEKKEAEMYMYPGADLLISEDAMEKFKLERGRVLKSAAKYKNARPK